MRILFDLVKPIIQDVRRGVVLSDVMMSRTSGSKRTEAAGGADRNVESWKIFAAAHDLSFQFTVLTLSVFLLISGPEDDGGGEECTPWIRPSSFHRDSPPALLPFLLLGCCFTHDGRRSRRGKRGYEDVSVIE